MRRYMDIITENSDLLEFAFGKLADYIQHNTPIDNHRISMILHQHGYLEPFGAGKYFRALLHDVPQKEGTLADIFPSFQNEIKMTMGNPQGFTTSLKKAEQFVNGTFHTSYGHEKFPIHNLNTPLKNLQSIAIIYEVIAPSDSILFSMKGLQNFIKIVPDSYSKTQLHHALNDMWEGYGNDDEVMIDTGKNVKIIGVHLYSSDSYFDEV